MSTRQLAAIMFTDIVGYTALMGQDEQKAFDLLKKNREIHKPLIEEFNGKWIKEMGDGILASFNTVWDAVSAAIKIQEAVNADKSCQLKIGIHLGEVLFENDDVFGDGVNIASRLQSIALPDTIYISEAVQNNIANKGFRIRFIKEEVLKNVKDPIKIFQVLFDNRETSVNQPKPRESNDKSIAVLPFTNMSSDPEQEYFSDGMAEEIINSLANLTGLRVAGRTSSFHFKGKNVNLQKIGEKLNVLNILEGSIRKQGIKLRITAQLIKVEDGFHLWSERFDRDVNDIFAIQEEIALAITEKLKITLFDSDKAVICKTPTENKEAYDLFLRGRYHYNQRGPSIAKALEYFQLAATIDPGFALAYSGIADCYSLLGFYCIISPHVAMPKATQNAKRAIELDNTVAEAYTTLGFISMYYDWDWTNAKKQFLFAFTLNPKYAPAHYWYCYFLAFIEQDFDEAIVLARRAAENLEPLVSLSHHVLAVAYINAGRFEESMKASHMAIEIDSKSFTGYRTLGISLAKLERYEEAIEAFEKSIALSSRHPIPLVELSWVYWLTGQADKCKEIKDELETRLPTEFISGGFLAGAAYYANEPEKAFEYLEIAFTQRDSSLTGLNTWPVSSFIRTDPRFKPFLERMNFPVNEPQSRENTK